MPQAVTERLTDMNSIARGVLCTLLFAFSLRGSTIAGEPSDSTSELSFVINVIKTSLAHVEVPSLDSSPAKHGTSFIVANSKNGRIILATCKHLFINKECTDSMAIDCDTSAIRVFLHKDPYQPYGANLLYLDSARDIALIDVTEPDLSKRHIQKVKFADIWDLNDGEMLACTGYDLTQYTIRDTQIYYWPSSHTGILSCKQVESVGDTMKVIKLLQADMMVNKGSSGSPVYRAYDGRVCGMVMSFQDARLGDFPINAGLVNIVPYPYIVASVKKALSSDEVEADSL